MLQDLQLKKSQRNEKDRPQQISGWRRKNNSVKEVSDMAFLDDLQLFIYNFNFPEDDFNDISDIRTMCPLLSESKEQDRLLPLIEL